MNSFDLARPGLRAHKHHRVGPSQGRWLALLVLLPLLASCGGGGGDCQITPADFDASYEPKKAREVSVPRDVLTYRLGKAKEWRLKVEGYTQACLGGLRASLHPSTPALPHGIELDTASGALRTTGMAVHAEGDCVGDHRGSHQRRCPDGTTFRARYYAVVIRTDHFVEAIPVLVSFEPDDWKP
ncbi:hypothetical protein OOZ63_22825 [Paucibacter sp. PLA-PC-4]|uniref:hypothetical protein n=1 Tax=Paucibacter sp. PLA-PC-4 TaxID=2993655 RepID=UPI00224AF6BE|nr:hypothetical protein [Paucibacter sp. PLA-PC-4]MCX2864670.1 hypothetical protein [Paucibacter sp. PLA-PC-4]